MNRKLFIIVIEASGDAKRFIDDSTGVHGS